jgi:hypothetical protein
MRPITKMSWLATASTYGRDIQKQRPEALTIECVMRVQDAATLSGSTALSTNRSLVQRLQLLMTQAPVNIRGFAL